jgi:hypothetical protein
VRRGIGNHQGKSLVPSNKQSSPFLVVPPLVSLAPPLVSAGQPLVSLVPPLGSPCQNTRCIVPLLLAPSSISCRSTCSLCTKHTNRLLLFLLCVHALIHTRLAESLCSSFPLDFGEFVLSFGLVTTGAKLSWLRLVLFCIRSTLL